MLLDTKGPEIRLRDFEKGEEILDDGQSFILTTQDVMGTKYMAAVTYQDFPKDAFFVRSPGT